MQVVQSRFILYNVCMKNLTFVISKSDKFLVASCSEEPIVTQGKTFDKLLSNIEEAVSLHLENSGSKKILSPYTVIYSNTVQNV